MKRLLLFCFAFLFTCSIFGQDKNIPPAPQPPMFVNNLSKVFPDFISHEETVRLEQKLDRFALESTCEIVIVIVDSIYSEDIGKYAMDLGNLWGIGQKEKNNGIVILIKPTGGPGNRKFFIATGKGLETILPDATIDQINQRELIPNFKNGDFYKGFDQTTSVLMSIIKGEISADEYNSKSK